MNNPATPPLLTTKLFMPAARENLVILSRLHERIDSCLNCRLILVTAPAGSGKTTLVTSWLSRQDKAVAWVSLDKNDDDPLIFLAYITAALHQIEAGVCETIRPLLSSTEPPPIPTLLTYLVNDLACLQKSAILVLDDYHTVTSARVSEVTEFLIENRPPNLQIIITSRAMPLFSVSRWRARNDIVEISAFDLRFSHEESRQFLNNVMQLDLADEEVAALHRRTEGWIAGLQLAALGLRDRPSSSRFLHEMSGDDRLIGDYLVDEVIEHQKLEVRQFLVRTSILHRLSAPLCNALLEIDTGQEHLLYLERSNLFLVALDNRRVWYRYHHLFGEMLRTRLEQKQPQIIPLLYQRAIQWHLDNDLVAEAIEYTIAAADYEQTAVILENNFSHFQNGSQRKRILQWAGAIPETVLKEHDVLWSQYILSLFYFADFDTALETLRRLWHETPMPARKSQIVRAIEYPLLAAIAVHTTLDAERARELTQQALAIMPDNNMLMRGIAMGHYGSASMYLGDLASARHYLAEALTLIGGTFSWSVINVFRNYLAETVATAGNLQQAAEEYDAIRQYVYAHGLQEGHTFASTLIGLALLHYEWNQLDEAARLVRQGQRLAETGRSIEVMLQAYRASIRLQLAGGENFDIKEKLDQIEYAAAKFQDPPLVMDQLEAFRSMLALREGDRAHAVRWAQTFAQQHAQKVSCLQQLEWLTVARIKLETGHEEACLRILQSLQALAQEQDRRRDSVRISVLLARTWYQSGEAGKGVSMLRDVLIAAEPEGFIRSFVDAGPPVQEMLMELLDGSAHASSGHPTLNYMQLILDAFPGTPETKPTPQLLTVREQEILQLLANGLTYAQITERLTITENTLKTHIKHVYSKLHVKNRMQAVLAAREMGIL